MFCPNCGKPANDQAVFCVNCGAKLPAVQVPAPEPPVPPAPIPEPTAPSFEQEIAQIEALQTPTAPTAVQQIETLQAQKEQEYENDMAAVQGAVAHFSPYKILFNNYFRACEAVNYYSRGAKSALLVWGIIVTALGMLFTLIGAIDSTYPEEILPFLIIFLLPGMAMLAGGITMKAVSRKKFANAKEEYVRLARELNALYYNCPACPLRPEFVDPDTLAKLRFMLQSGRAHSLSEAVYLLSDGYPQSRLNNYINTLADHTKDVNQQNSISCIFVPASLFL